MSGRYPEMVYTEEGMREGMQIEDANIPIDANVALLDALSETGLKRIHERALCGNAAAGHPLQAWSRGVCGGHLSLEGTHHQPLLRPRRAGSAAL